MQTTYKCKNGHKFKDEQGTDIKCPTCNEHAEPVRWNTITGEFPKVPFGLGIKKDLSFIAETFKETIKGK
ncbi:MAG: hypothetical protein JXN64_10270 [Spirochaetes bacterium]|nr:hypothetical protein [Spirochaetota bacterium]